MTRVKPEPVSRRYDVTDARDRHRIREALEHLGPSERTTEAWCDWVFVFEDEGERLVLKQYQKGTLMIQGRAGHLLQVILHVLSPFLNDSAETSRDGTGGAKTRNLSLPHIGSDESGKGDYFGPLVVGGVLVETGSWEILSGLGIKDSKKLGDARCRKLAAEIRKVCVERYCEVIIPPERYNTLYEEFRREGRNLNHLLAWAHARAIESLLDRTPCQLAVADQFGNEYYIRSRLMNKGRGIELIQEHKGERNLAVAAASILARDRFLEYLDRLSAEAGMTLPRGAGAPVVEAALKYVERHGADRLAAVAKLHHKTTARVV